MLFRSATLIGADQLFFLTVAPGLLKEEETQEGKRSTVVEKVEELTDEILQHCLPITSAGGKGGMESKVRSAGMAMSFGIDTFIMDGKSPAGVSDVMEGQRRGTHFVAHGRKIRSYQKWLAAGALNKGTLVIDAGAEQALMKNKKSLLAKGVDRKSTRLNSSHALISYAVFCLKKKKKTKHTNKKKTKTQT